MTSSLFAPSELVLLFGDRFAPVGSLLGPREELLTSAVKVHGHKLMDAVMAVALLSLHRADVARLELRTGKALFGLMKTRKLHLVAGPATPPFPTGTLEADLATAAAAAPTVEDALAAYLGAETDDPGARLFGLLKAAMAERGVLEVADRKSLLVFTTSTYTLPDTMRQAADAAPTAPLETLLRTTRAHEPDLMNALQQAIQAARVRMTKDTD